MRFLLSSLFLLVVIVSPIRADPYENKLPIDAADALHAPEKVILYSLEPLSLGTTNNLHGFKILGQATLDGKQAVAAAAAFESAICEKERKWEANCFDPRHAIRMKSKGHSLLFALSGLRSRSWLGVLASCATIIGFLCFFWPVFRG